MGRFLLDSRLQLPTSERQAFMHEGHDCWSAVLCHMYCWTVMLGSLPCTHSAVLRMKLASKKRASRRHPLQRSWSMRSVALMMCLRVRAKHLLRGWGAAILTPPHHQPLPLHIHTIQPPTCSCQLEMTLARAPPTSCRCCPCFYPLSCMRGLPLSACGSIAFHQN